MINWKLNIQKKILLKMRICLLYKVTWLSPCQFLPKMDHSQSSFRTIKTARNTISSFKISGKPSQIKITSYASILQISNKHSLLFNKRTNKCLKIRNSKLPFWVRVWWNMRDGLWGSRNALLKIKNSNSLRKLIKILFR